MINLEVQKGQTLKVAAKSNAKAVAGALSADIRAYGKAELHAVGAAAVNVAIKAIAIARGYLAPNGIDLVCIPAFVDIEIENQERTGIRLLVFPR